MCLLIISAAKAHRWAQCQLPQALDLLPRLSLPHITMYIPKYLLRARQSKKVINLELLQSRTNWKIFLQCSVD